MGLGQTRWPAYETGANTRDCREGFVRRRGVADICAATPDLRSSSHPHRLLTVLASGVLGAAWYSLSALELSCRIPVILMQLALSEYERLLATVPYLGGRPTNAMRSTARPIRLAGSALDVDRASQPAPPTTRTPGAKGTDQ
jgi:hypothetical protein